MYEALPGLTMSFQSSLKAKGTWKPVFIQNQSEVQDCKTYGNHDVAGSSFFETDFKVLRRFPLTTMSMASSHGRTLVKA